MADLLFADLRRPRRPRRVKPPINIENFTDEELRNRFRFGRQGIGYITNLIADELCRSTRRNHALPPLQPLHQVLIALRFYASGSFLQVIGDTAGVDKSTVSRVVTNVSNAFKLVTLLMNLLCRMAKFSSTFSVKIEISEALKLCFLGLRDPSPKAILVLFAGCKKPTRKKIPSVLWDANLELVTVNPRLTNLSFNPALNNAILTRN